MSKCSHGIPASVSCVSCIADAVLRKNEERHDYLIEQDGEEPVIMKLITKSEAENLRRNTPNCLITQIE